MKKIECEACGSNDLLKQGDFFVCQNCGCKYTVEDVRKMMIEGTVEVKGTVSIDKSKEEENTIEVMEMAFKNGDYGRVYDLAKKLTEINPKNYKGWYYQGVRSPALYAPSSFTNRDLIEPTTEINLFEKAYSVASSEEKDEIRPSILKQLTEMVLGRLKNVLNNEKNKKDEFQKTIKIVNPIILNIYKKFNGDSKGMDDAKDQISIIIHDLEDGASAKIMSDFVIKRQFLAGRFNGKKEDSTGSGDSWANDNIDLINQLIDFVSTNNIAPEMVEKSYTMLLETCKQLINARQYSYDYEYSRRTKLYSYVYNDHGMVLNDKAQENIRSVWKSMKEAKPGLLEKANKRETEYHALKNKIYWSAHKEEKEKLESQLSSADKRVKPYLVQISELDEDIASQKALLSKPLKEEDNALALKKEADEAQAAFKKLGLFDKNRKAAKGVWEQKQNTYEAAKKVADKARSDFNARIKANIKELEDEKAGLVKAKEGIEKELNYAKNELNKNR